MKLRNIKLTYSYFDGKWNIERSEVLANPSNLSIDTIRACIQSGLRNGASFDPLEWGLQPIDFAWNDFDRVTVTIKKPTTALTVDELIGRIAEWKDNQRFFIGSVMR